MTATPSGTAGTVVWVTGLPAAGKSLFAAEVKGRLDARGRAAVVLDSDALRAVLGGALGYGSGDREAFYRALAELAALLAAQGLVVLVPATAHRRAFRAAARALAPRFVEVHVTTPLATCEGRDPKGLYAAARAGRAPDLPGVGLAYEPPETPEVVASGGLDSAAMERVLTLVS